jgi:N-acetyltransferase 10
MKKKVDPRVRQLLENAVASHTRAFFIIVGDKGREQVVNLHYIMSKATVKARPTVLWCYKKELGFSSHKQKRMKEIKKKAERGQIDIETIQDDPFELFITSTKIRYCYYNETHTILGHTYGMLVLQDFEAMTPNLLARTIETVEGGGCVVLLLKTMTSLKQLYSMTMDVHTRFRTHSHQSVVARFNERFLLSLRDCASCLVLDDGPLRPPPPPQARHARSALTFCVPELNVLPVTAEGPLLSLPKAPEGDSPDLAELKASLASTPPSGVLVALAKTIDQAKAVLTFIEAISEKTLRSTVALTAGRGRGKSAALGISMAAAIA